MLTKVNTCALTGHDGQIIEVEVVHRVLLTVCTGQPRPFAVALVNVPRPTSTPAWFAEGMPVEGDQEPYVPSRRGTGVRPCKRVASPP